MSKPRVLVGSVVVGLALLAGGAVAGNLLADRHSDASSTSVRTSGGSALGVLSDCGIKPPIEKSAAITLTCADGGIALKSLAWNYWGSSMATGLGTMRENSCIPDCAQGSDLLSPVEVVLDLPKATASGQQFSRALVVDQSNAQRKPQVFELTPYPAN